MQLFFILALGRSGTNFLSRLLARDTRALVHHEPYALDPRLMMLRHSGGFERALDDLLEERFRALLPADGAALFYGEVNSYLRYEAEWLRRRFDPTLIHLVRDGRDFVRSAHPRGVYTRHELDGPIVPPDGDPWSERWSDLSRFQRLCWYWTHTNEHLTSTIASRVRFEDLLRDYELFRNEILQPIGLEIPQTVWRAEIDHPRNTSRGYRLRLAVRRLLRGRERLPSFKPLPHWSEWDEAPTEQFWEICGDTMRRCGYGE
jgi:hypothetical protein